MAILVGDLETNGLRPNRIWVVGIKDVETGEYTSYVGDEEVPIGLMRLAEADIVIGHNFKGYDAKVIENLTDGLIKIDNSKIVDTVELSRKLFPELENHKLETWGDVFEFPKIKYDKGFEQFHPDMVPYCERDVELNAVLYQFMMDHIEQLEASDCK
jgi:DNA polymerase III alpha subunit (gram-positive type)